MCMSWTARYTERPLAQSSFRRARYRTIARALGPSPKLWSFIDYQGRRRRSVVWLVLRQGLGLVVAGLVAGIAKSLVVTTLMSGLLFDTPATDTLTFVGVAGLLVFIATAACLLPARRALSVDPVQALRRT